MVWLILSGRTARSRGLRIVPATVEWAEARLFLRAGGFGGKGTGGNRSEDRACFREKRREKNTYKPCHGPARRSEILARNISERILAAALLP